MNIYIAPNGRNFRGTGGRSDQCSVTAWVNKKSLKSRFKNVQRAADQICLWQRVPERWCRKSESTPGKVCPGERLVQQRDGRLNVKFGCRHVLRFGGVGKPEFTELETNTSLFLKVLRTRTEADPYHRRTRSNIERKLFGSFASQLFFQNYCRLDLVPLQRLLVHGFRGRMRYLWPNQQTVEAPNG